MPTSDATLKPAAFSEVPGWRSDDHLAALKAFLKSCEAVIEAAGEGKTGAGATTAELARACRAARALKAPTRATARAFFESHFRPYRVVQKKGEGFLTGYYEPVLMGSRTPQGPYRVPIYRRPPDLVNVVAESERAKAEGLTHLRKTAKGTEPFPTRAAIEQGALAGQGLELLYLKDPVDAFFMHVQGSGRIRLTDGSSVRLNYDGKNGYPYTSVGRYLVDKGYFTVDAVTLQALRKWLRADPERGKAAMWQNESFIFFRELAASAEGAQGAMSVALTPGRSLAVDTAYHTLGTPIYVVAPALRLAGSRDGFKRLMVAQDVGSAIKGPQRGDIYYGSGDKAGRLAGITKHAGRFFVLLPVAGRTTAELGGRQPQRASWQRKQKAER